MKEEKEIAHLAAPSPEHRRLGVFLGNWKTDGEIRATDTSPAVKFQATDTYQWLDGGFFLVHRWDARMPDGDSKGIEILGYDPASKTYFMHSFDNLGNIGVMEGTVDGDHWTFIGEFMRFRGGFRDGGQTLSGTWDQRSNEGALWIPWMDVRLTR